MLPLQTIIQVGSKGVDELRRLAQDWARQVVTLYNTPVPAELQPKKDKLLNRAKGIKTSVEALTGAIPELAELDQVQLGIAPILVGVGVAAAASMMGYWLYDYKKFLAEVDSKKAAAEFYNQQINAGASPAQAAQAVRAAFGSKFNLKAFAIAALLVGGLFTFYKFKKG